jgi:CRISPR-associated endonuclease/helicase Cas3
MGETMLLSNFGVDGQYLAHTSSKYKSETLIEHSNLTYEYYNKLIKAKNLEYLIDKLINKIDSKNFILIKEMFENTIYLHDLGKKNPCFQAKKMNNPLFKEVKCSDSKHSLQGAIEFIEYYKEKINLVEDDIEYHRLVYILYNFSYHISKHHGTLDTLEKYFSKNKKEKEEHISFNNAKKGINSYIDKKFEFFILNKLLFSLLISSDYYATTEYMTKIPFNEFGTIKDKKVLKDIFQNHIKSFGEPKGINVLRNEISKGAQNILISNLNKNIFYLEAPTGSGKTLMSINLALELLDSNDNLNKLFYIFPFNTLVEQTKNVFDKIFKDKLDISVINSVTPIEYKNDEIQEDEESKYNKAYVNRLFFNSPAVITTHVTLFNILFGTSKEDNFSLWQLANSVIILDEIQSYNNHLWWYMVEFFEKYATLLNIKIIIMSATLPKLDFFLEKKDSFVELIPKEKKDDFFTNDYFKNRVKIEYLDLSKKIKFKELEQKLKIEQKHYPKVLFEFIKKQSARDFYKYLEEKGYTNIYELSGDDNKAFRQYVINKTKDNKPIIVVATQVIEAGVDIDMDLGFKDISTIDSEEQFMGRINRNSERDGKVYFFHLDDVETIYKGDNRLGYDLKNYEYRKILENKDFEKYYENVLKDIKDDKTRFKSGLMTSHDYFHDAIKKLDYKKIDEEMTLIKTDTFTLYFPFLIDISEYKNIKEFENLNEIFKTDEKLDGQKVWDEFVALNEIENFTQREVLKSKVNSLMQFFTFNIFKYYDGHRPHVGEDMYGYYFVENLEYITDEGKFDREKFNKDKDSKFL